MQGPKPGSGAVMWTGALGLGLGLHGLGLGPRRQVGLELLELGMGWYGLRLLGLGLLVLRLCGLGLLGL